MFIVPRRLNHPSLTFSPGTRRKSREIKPRHLSTLDRSHTYLLCLWPLVRTVSLGSQGRTFPGWLSLINRRCCEEDSLPFSFLVRPLCRKPKIRKAHCLSRPRGHGRHGTKRNTRGTRFDGKRWVSTGPCQREDCTLNSN